VRLAGKPIGPVEWLIGGFFYDENVQGNSTYNQYLVSSIQSYTIGTKSYAGFGRLVFHAKDHFRLVAGGRYTRDESASMAWPIPCWTCAPTRRRPLGMAALAAHRCRPA
jgi:outer membrane receptor protein involved in Fe transport